MALATLLLISQDSGGYVFSPNVAHAANEQHLLRRPSPDLFKASQQHELAGCCSLAQDRSYRINISAHSLACILHNEGPLSDGLGCSYAPAPVLCQEALHLRRPHCLKRPEHSAQRHEVRHSDSAHTLLFGVEDHDQPSRRGGQQETDPNWSDGPRRLLAAIAAGAAAGGSAGLRACRHPPQLMGMTGSIVPNAVLQHKQQSATHGAQSAPVAASVPSGTPSCCLSRQPLQAICPPALTSSGCDAYRCKLAATKSA